MDKVLKFTRGLPIYQVRRQKNTGRARSKGVSVMLTIVINLAAFYLGVVIFERAGFLCGAAAFLVMVLTSTIIGSRLEEHIRFYLSRERGAHCGSRAGAPAVKGSLP